MSDRGTGTRGPERVMSLEDVFLSREFGQIRGLAPSTSAGLMGTPDLTPLAATADPLGPRRHASTTHRRFRSVRAASGLAAALIVAMSLVTGAGRTGRGTVGPSALSGRTPTPPSARVRSHPRTPAPSTAAPAAWNAAAPAPTAKTTPTRPTDVTTVDVHPGTPAAAGLTGSPPAPTPIAAPAPEPPAVASAPAPTAAPNPSATPTPAAAPTPAATPSPTRSVSPTPTPTPAFPVGPAAVGTVLDTVVTAVDDALDGVETALKSAAPGLASVIDSLQPPSGTPG